MTRTGDPARGTRDGSGGRPRSGGRLAALGVLAVLLAAGCGRAEERDASQEGASYRRPKNAAGRADSVRVADAARGELRRRGRTDSLLVASFTRASNGYLVRLVPAADPAAQGASLWVDEDGSVTLMQEYRP